MLAGCLLHPDRGWVHLPVQSLWRLLVNKRFGLFVEPSDLAAFNGFLAAVIEAALREVADDIQQKGADIRLSLPAGLRVQADPFSLGQVLRNLIANALK